MRALAAYEPDEWLSPAAARGTKELEKLGFRRGRDSPTLVRFVDPIEDDRKRPKGEDPRGLELRRHPLAMLRDAPEVWDLADELMDGVVGDLTAEDRRTRSEAEWCLILAYKAAEARRMEREIRRGMPKGKGASDGERQG